MSGSVDDEIVRMRFDNNAFERGVATTIGTLAKLKNSLSFGGKNGFDDLENKAKKLDMSNANKQIDDSAHHWNAWRAAGLIAFATVVHRAVNAGINVVKAFTINPLKDGFENYQNQINATKIILSNTAASGAKLKDVSKVLDDMQKYAQLTVYNFADMAKNVGTFTANGVALKPAAAAIKGIANIAALSGASSEDASRAMYQLSQAIGQGSVKLQDWNSVQNANIGTNTFKNALVNSAVAMGTLTKSAVKFTGPMKNVSIAGESFRNSLTAKPGQTGWLTSKVLTNTLAQFTGQVSKAQLITEGFTSAQADAIIKTGKMALSAATQVKTWDQLTQALKEEVSGAYAQVFKTIFGDLPNATKLFSALHTVLENMLTGPILGFNKFLQQVDKLGGRTVFLKAFTSVFHSLGQVFETIKGAYRDIFPATTAKQVVGLIRIFSRFAAVLSGFVKSNSGSIANTFKGIFAIFDIGKQIVSAIFHVFVQLFSQLSGGGSTVLGFTSHIGLMIVSFDQALKAGNLFGNAAKIVGNVLTSMGHIIGIAASAIRQLFSGFKPRDASGVTNSVTRTGDALARLAQLTQNMSNWFGSLGSKIQPGIQAVVRGMKKIGSAIAQGLDSQAFGNILKGLQVGLLGGIVVMLKKFFSGGINVDVGKGFLGTAKEALEGVTGQMKAMQQELKAKMLLEIAGAIGIIAVAVVALSLVNPTKLQNALKAMAVGFGELLGAMAILTKISGSAGFVKIPIMAASLNLLATAILILTAAVALMSRLSWAELQKGLTAVGILLGIIVLATYPLSANAAGMIRAGVGIAAMAVALNLLYIPVKLFSMMSWSELRKGLIAVAVALGGVALAMRAMPKGMLLQGAALILIATAVNELYLAVKLFSGLSWKELAKGLVGVAGGLTAIAIGMALMPKGMLFQSIALIAVGAALQLISRAVQSMAKMSWSEIGRGLTTLAGSLLILAGGLFLMQESVGGAVALLIVAGALHVFVPALSALGHMKWSVILKGLGALAAAFGVLGLASLILAPVIPAMLGLGVALGLVGVALLAFGAGAALLGIGLTAIAASGGAAIGVLLTGLKGLIAMLPALAVSLGTALVGFLTIIGKNAPVIIGAFVKLLDALLEAIPKIVPKLVPALGALITGFLKVLTDNAPRIIRAGFELLLDLLRGIRDNIGEVVKTVVDIVVKFLDALAHNIGRIVAAGVNLLFKFLEGVARAAGQIPSEVVKIVGIFLSSLFGNFGKIVSAGGKMIGRFISGIGDKLGDVASAGVRMIAHLISGFFSKLDDIAGAAYRVVTKFIGSVIGGIGDFVSNIAQAGWNIAKHLVDGMVNGIKSLAHDAVDAAKGLAGDIVGAVGDFIGMGGPAKVFEDIGSKGIGQGMVNGMNKAHKIVTDAATNLSNEGVNAVKKSMNNLSKAISDKNFDYSPKIRPILDLDQFRKDATEIGGLITTSPVVPVASYDQAVNISARQMEAKDSAVTTPAAETPVIQQNLTQNNYSPKALSTVDIYRGTKNQLALARQVAGVPVATSVPE